MAERRVRHLVVAALLGVVAGGIVVAADLVAGWGLAALAAVVVAVAWLDRAILRDAMGRLRRLEGGLGDLSEQIRAADERSTRSEADGAERHEAVLHELAAVVRHTDEVTADLQDRLERLRGDLAALVDDGERRADRRHEHLLASVGDLLDALDRPSPTTPHGSAGVPAEVAAAGPDRDVIADSGLFDPGWYAEEHAAHLAEGESPLEHYLTEGWRLGLDPSPRFSIDDYRRRVAVGPDVEPVTDFLHRAKLGALPPARPRSAPLDQRSREHRWSDLLAGAYRWPASFALYRILGNDLPPRHPAGQTRDNLAFILDHEPDLPGCEKWWIVNRILDRDEEAAIIDLLASREQRFLVRSVDPAREVGAGWSWTEAAATIEDDDPWIFLGGPERRRPRRPILAAYRHKIRALIDINGARNLALRHGWQRATWVLPWDGGCFVSRTAWDEITGGLRHEPSARYLVVPMERLRTHDLLNVPTFRPPARDEPMVGFRRDARERFDPSRAYGDRDKVALLRSLGVEGPWDGWRWGDTDPPHAGSVDSGRFVVAGWQGRLPSGRAELDGDLRDRWAARADALVRLVDEYDQRGARAHLDAKAPATVDPTGLAALRTELEGGGPPSVEVAELLQQAEQVAATEDAASSDRGPVADLLAVVLASRIEDAGEFEAAASRRLRSVEALLGPADAPPGRDVPSTPFVLDAARLLSTGDDGPDELRTWAERRADTLGEPGHDGWTAVDARGTWFDVEQAAVAAYLGDVPTLLEAVKRVEERLLYQLDADSRPVASTDDEGVPDGADREELLRQVAGWTVAAQLARTVGIELADRDVAGRRLRWAFSSVFQAGPPSGHDVEVAHRWRALRATVFGPPSGPGGDQQDGAEAPAVLPAGLGIRPFWAVAAAPVLPADASAQA